MKKKIKITAGNVSIGKVIVPVEKHRFDRRISDKITKLVAKYNQPAEWSFPYLCLRDLNRFCKDVYSDVMYNSAKCDTWKGVIIYLKDYIDFRYNTSDNANDIMSYVKDFFSHMPFIDINEEKLRTTLLYSTDGYCCEDCDGNKEDFDKFHLMNNLNKYCDILNDYNITLIIK